MTNFKRLWRHLTTGQASGRRAFPREVLAEIQKTIAEGEQLHRAEMRIIIEPAMPLDDVLENIHPRARARTLFSDYRVWDTEENCGVLIYLNLADHQVEIVADRLCVETKSLKQYFWSYRNEGAFHEKVTNLILTDLVKAIQPRYARIHADWFVRGGIRTFVTAEHRKKGWKPAPRIELPQG